MEGPLTGVRILDLTNRVAGPAGTLLLGDFGAEIIKIEPPSGEPVRTRFAGPTLHGDYFLYLAYNRNKKSVCLDLYTPAGRDAFYELVKVSDVVYNNFRPGVMSNLGADYATLSQVNPRIICFSSTGFGSTGPGRHRPGVDMLAQAESGLMSITGLGDEPVKYGPAIVDICTGIFGALAVMAALAQRERTGRGQEVETCLMNVAVFLMTTHIAYYLLSGEEPPRLGNGNLVTAPQGAYKCGDGQYVALGSCWPRIARVIGEEWLLDDPRFSNVEGRAAHRREMDEILGRAFLKMSAQDWVDVLQLEDINAAPVNTTAKVVEHPQVLHQGMILQLAHALGGQIGAVDNPIRMTGGPNAKDYTPPPLLGEHTNEVLAKLLGYSDEQIAELTRQQDQHASDLEKHTVKQR